MPHLAVYWAKTQYLNAWEHARPLADLLVVVSKGQKGKKSGFGADCT